MKIVKSAVLALGLLSAATAPSLAGSVPSMIGDWEVKSEGGVLTKEPGPDPKCHHSGEFSSLTAKVVVDKQQGRVFFGTFTSPRYAEKFVCVFEKDNKNINCADEDGYFEGRMVNKDRMDTKYRHISPKSSVVAVGVWSRKK